MPGGGVSQVSGIKNSTLGGLALLLCLFFEVELDAESRAVKHNVNTVLYNYRYSGANWKSLQVLFYEA